MKRIILFIGVNLICSFASLSIAQVNLNNMPNNEKNTRFNSDRYDIKRPALSIRGFDTDNLNDYPDGGDHGLGLKQILELVYNETDLYKKELYRVPYEEILLEARKSLKSGNERSDVEHNTRVLQYRAFEALVSYILEKNNPSTINSIRQETSPHLRPHSVALDSLIQPILNPGNGVHIYLYRDGNNGQRPEETDGVKWTRNNGNLSRMWDLYLALENAYLHFESANYTNSKLLSQQQKNTHYKRYIDRSVDELNYMVELTPKSRLNLVSIQEFERCIFRYFKAYFVYSNFINIS